MKTRIAIAIAALAPALALAQVDQDILGYTPKKPLVRNAPLAGPGKAAPVKPPYTAVQRYPAPKTTVTATSREQISSCVYKPVMTDEEIRNCS